MSKITLTKSFLIYGIGNMLYTAIILLLIPIYLEKLNVQDYGIFSVFYVTGNIFSIIFSLSISNGILRYFADYQDQKYRRSAISTMIFSFGFFFCILAALFYFMPSDVYQWIFSSDNQKTGIFIMLIWAFCRIYYNMLLGILRAEEKPGQYVILTIIDVVILCVINTYIIFFTAFDLYDILTGYLIASFISMFIGFFIIRRNIEVGFNMLALKYLIAYGLPLSIANVVSYLTSYGNRYFLLYYTDEKHVAIFDVAQKITGVIGVVLVNAFMIAFTPYYLNLYVRTDIENFQKNINKVIHVFINVFFLLGLCIVFFDNYLLDLLSKKEYINSALYTPFLVLANAFNVLFMLLAMTTNINKKTRIEMIITIIMLFSGCGLNIFLIQKYGLIGAAFSQILMALIGFLCINIYNKKFFPLNFKYMHIGLIILVFITLSFIDRFVSGLQANIFIKIGISIFMLFIYLLVFKKQWVFAKELFYVIKNRS